MTIRRHMPVKQLGKLRVNYRPGAHVGQTLVHCQKLPWELLAMYFCSDQSSVQDDFCSTTIRLCIPIKQSLHRLPVRWRNYLQNSLYPLNLFITKQHHICRKYLKSKPLVNINLLKPATNFWNTALQLCNFGGSLPCCWCTKEMEYTFN